jgi:hypothetical protein
MEGFYEVIPRRAMQLFTPVELGLKLAGTKRIDLEDLKKHW